MKSWLFLIVFGIIANHAFGGITASSVTGPATIEPGKTATFRYRLAGTDWSVKTVPAVFYLSNSTVAPTGASSERIGGINAPLDFQGLVDGFPRYKASALTFPTDQVVPTSLTHSSWPFAVRIMDTIPPGNYYIVLNVLNTFASYPVTVLPMTITSFTPASAAVGQTIQISGAFLDRAKGVRINGTEVFSFDWTYSQSSKQITAKVPDSVTIVGKVEVFNSAQSVQSTPDFSLKLPDLVPATNPVWGAKHVISHQPNPVATSVIYAGATSYLRILLKNDGTLPTASNTNVVLTIDGTLAAAIQVPSPLAIGASQIVTLTLPKMSPGSHSLRVVVDESIYFNRELSETNNTLLLTQTVTAHPVDQWRALHFPGGVISDPTQEATVYGDNADPDKDSVVNLFEYIGGTNPMSGEATQPPNAPGISFSESGGLSRPVLTYTVSTAATQYALMPETTNNLGAINWATPQAGVGYELTTQETANARIMSYRFMNETGSRFFARLKAVRTY